MGEPVETKWEMSLRQKVGRILRALWSGSTLILILAIAIAIAKQWWWVIGSGLALAGLMLIFLLFADKMIREENARYPAAGAIATAFAEGFRICTIELGEAGGATVRITAEVVRVEWMERFVELDIYREEDTWEMCPSLMLDISKWSIENEGDSIVLTRVEPDEARLLASSLTPNLVSLRLTHAQVH